MALPPQTLKGVLQLCKYPGSARQQQPERKQRGGDALAGFLRAGKRLLHHLRPLRAYDTADLVDQAGFNVATIQPPAHHSHQQYQQRRQAENAVKRHGRTHAQTFGV